MSVCLCVGMNVRYLRMHSLCLGGAYEMVYNVRKCVTHYYCNVEVIMQSCREPMIRLSSYLGTIGPHSLP